MISKPLNIYLLITQIIIVTEVIIILINDIINTNFQKKHF